MRSRVFGQTPRMDLRLASSSLPPGGRVVPGMDLPSTRVSMDQLGDGSVQQTVRAPTARRPLNGRK